MIDKIDGGDVQFMLDGAGATWQTVGRKVGSAGRGGVQVTVGLGLPLETDISAGPLGYPAPPRTAFWTRPPSASPSFF